MLHWLMSLLIVIVGAPKHKVHIDCTPRITDEANGTVTKRERDERYDVPKHRALGCHANVCARQNVHV